MDYLHIFDGIEEYNEEIGWGYGQMPAVSICDKNFDEVEDRPAYVKKAICELTYKGPTSNLFHSDYNIKSVSIDGEYVYNNTNERTWKEFTITPDDVSNTDGILNSNLPDDKMVFTKSAPIVELTTEGGVLATDEIALIFPRSNQQGIIVGQFAGPTVLKDGVLTTNFISLDNSYGEVDKVSFIIYRNSSVFLTTNVRYFSVDEITTEDLDSIEITDENKTITFEPFNRFAPILLQGTDILSYHSTAFMHNTGNELLPIQFSSCPYLESITLPKSINRFDFTAINGCNNLKTIICRTRKAPYIPLEYSCNDIPNVIVQVPKGGDYSGWEAHPYFIKNNWQIEYV